MSTTRCTVVNFNVSELLHKTKRLQAIETIALTTGDFEFATRTQQKAFIPQSLLTNNDIDLVVRYGFKGAKETMAQFSEYQAFLTSNMQFW